MWSVVALLVALCVSACRPSDTAPPARRALVVFAAASLREGLNAVAEGFERAHPEVDVQLSFAGTQALRAQLEQGAAADVFASADQTHMDALRDSGFVDAPVTFARTHLVLVVSTEASARLRSFGDLSNAERVVVGAPEVPVGRYTALLLERADAALGAGFAARVRAGGATPPRRRDDFCEPKTGLRSARIFSADCSAAAHLQ